MSNVIDFVTNALPWIAIGLFVAVSSVRAHLKAEGKELSGLLKALTWSPFICFVFVAILEFSAGKKSSAITWLILGVFNAVTNYANESNMD